MYLVVAIVVYRYTGLRVSSPALSSTSNVVMKVAYGIALPTVSLRFSFSSDIQSRMCMCTCLGEKFLTQDPKILLAGVIYGHVASKYVYVRLFRGTKHMAQRTLLSIGSWAGITFTFWLIAWIIAESIPNFNDLLALISSLFASWFTYGMSGIFWLFLNWGGDGRGWWKGYTRNWRKIILTVVNVVIVGIGAAVCGIGLYASGKAIHDESGNASWTCADNSKE